MLHKCQLVLEPLFFGHLSFPRPLKIVKEPTQVVDHRLHIYREGKTLNLDKGKL